MKQNLVITVTVYIKVVMKFTNVQHKSAQSNLRYLCSLKNIVQRKTAIKVIRTNF